LRERRTIHVPDTSDPSARTEFPDSPSHSGIARLNVPLIHNDVVVGALILYRDTARAYSAREISLIETFADQAAIAVANARLFQELQDRVEELQRRGAVGQAVSSSLDLQEVLTTIVSHAVRLSG